MDYRTKLPKALLGFLTFTLFFSACAATQITQEPVTDHSKRYEFEKFSVLPPQGDNWFLLISKVQGGRTLLMFGKQVKPGTALGVKSFQPHTVRADVTAQNVGDEDIGSPQKFLDMIRQSERANTSERFVVLEETYSLHDKVGEYCVLVTKHNEDHGVPSDPDRVYMFSYNSLFCYDRSTQMMIKLSCSQRAPEKKDMLNIESECDPFIDSLKFNQ